MSKCRACGGEYFGYRCVPCRKKYLAAYYADPATQGMVKEKKQEYYQSNRDKWKAYGAERYTEKRGEILDACREYRSNNKDAINARNAQYRAANPDKVKAAIKRWKAANPEALRAHNKNRKVAKKGGGGKLSAGLAQRLFELQRGKCACCGLPLGNDYHMDHIMPLFLGGENIDANIQLLRNICNLRKNKKHPIAFMQEKGFLL